MVAGFLRYDPVGQYGTSLIGLGVAWVTPYVVKEVKSPPHGVPTLPFFLKLTARSTLKDEDQWGEGNPTKPSFLHFMLYFHFFVISIINIILFLSSSPLS